MKPKVSFEFFPPKTDRGMAKLRSCAKALSCLDPEFMSVTYGAGGATQDRTIATITDLHKQSLPVAGHITCVGKSKADVDLVVDQYDKLGVHHIVALRGDPPQTNDNHIHSSGYKDAVSLVAGIRSRTNIGISVAAYPEIHPKAQSETADIDNLKRKLDAGADQAITQFFFDTDIYFRFLEKARSAGIVAPIIPGIMPITNFGGIERFAARCGTSIPKRLKTLFDGLDALPNIRDLISVNVAAEQCVQLLAEGIDSFHFYTMNRSALTIAVCRLLGVSGTPSV